MTIAYYLYSNSHFGLEDHGLKLVLRGILYSVSRFSAPTGCVMPLRGTAGERKAWKRQTAKVQKHLQKTRRVPAVRCIIPALVRDALLGALLKRRLKHRSEPLLIAANTFIVVYPTRL
jgi:hypothetical protein